MKAKKQIENKTEGDIQTIKYHVIEIKENLSIEWICDKLGLYDEDGEIAYMQYGICFSPDDIHSVCVTKFIEGVEEWLSDENEDYVNIEKEDVDIIRDELKKLEKYKDYDIWL